MVVGVSSGSGLASLRMLRSYVTLWLSRMPLAKLTR